MMHLGTGPGSSRTTLLLPLVLVACSGQGGGRDADAGDLGAEEAVECVEPPVDLRDPDDGFRCCEMGMPTCECTGSGGSPDQPAGCHDICDTRPDGWVTMVDDNGCLYWHVPEGTPSCSEPAVEGIEEEPEPVADPVAEEHEPEPIVDADTG